MMERKTVTDLTFITNEPGRILKDRFNVLGKESRFFDCLIGYFYLSGFRLIYPALEKADRIRILVGIGMGRKGYESVEESKQKNWHTSYETKQIVEEEVKEEMEESEDDKDVELGVKKFIEWIKNKKLEIRAYPSDIHAKLYIFTFPQGYIDVGRIITGSSNLTRSGLKENLEFNVELKNPADYEFARQKFEELWKDSVNVSEKYVQTIQTKTWLKEDITPYELYLKFLYEYFRDELKPPYEFSMRYLPQDFKKLEYQKQAVLNAKEILEEYGGVFISDVVGLGKTYISAILAKEIEGRTLVIAPPALLREENPGSWRNVFSDFNIPADCVSIGKLDEALKKMEEREYDNVIIDESHRFRSETTIGYDKLAQICRGKRVILVTATPYNNSPNDLLNQIKLFQNPRKSTIPGLPGLEGFFKRLNKRLNEVDRKGNYDEYIKITKENAKEIREKVLKYIMVRRTRAEIRKYYKSDLEKNKIKFPEVKPPHPIYYQLNEREDRIFMETMRSITQEFKYARYTPLLYLKQEIKVLEKQSQRNMEGFMKVLLVKRLESSFYAFKRTIDRFINSYQQFLKAFDNGRVFVSKKYINKIFELIESDNDEEIQHLLDEEKAKEYSKEEFREDFRRDLENDLAILKRIKDMWNDVKRDPKLEELQRNLSKNEILRKNKVIIFTESKETAEYLTENVGDKALCYTGSSSKEIANKVIDNFDARARYKRNDYQILISTEVLSEGVNLHRSNVVVNYDIPWNPTRMMQRVGRVNRIDTDFDAIYTFNFFPTKQSDDEIELTKIARSKIETFLTLLGGDASILTEGEPIGHHELFDRLLSTKILDEELEEESELKYLNVIKDIRDKNPQLFEKIKRLPKKARSAKRSIRANSLLTYFRKGKLQKFFITNAMGETQELDFITAAKVLESSVTERCEKIPLDDYYALLRRNKGAFFNATNNESFQKRSGRDSSARLENILRATLKNGKRLTDEQEANLERVKERLKDGAIPKRRLMKTLKALKDLKPELDNPLKVYAIVSKNIPRRLLEKHYSENYAMRSGKREVILSVYLAGDSDG